MKKRASTSIMIEGLHNARLAARIDARVTETLGRVAPPPAVAKIIFADENGSKGGVGTRCTIVFHVPRRRDLTVTELGDTTEAAFDAAYAALSISVTREAARRRELVRRPKKYFLAKRLLAADTKPEALEAPSTRPKRVRRRRVA